jgi:hypothetical protein
VETFLREAGVDELIAHDVSDAKKTRPGLFEGVHLTADAVVDLAREMLREDPVSARLEAEGRFYLHVGDRMNMWIGTDRECPNAVAETRRIGLFVDEGMSSPDWDETPADRHWWLEEGAPIRYSLDSFARGDGEPLGSREIPADRVDALRRLFRPKRYDPNFRDRYAVGDEERTGVATILEVDLDPTVDYVVNTYSVE